MTLAANGTMSIGGTTATRSINLELGRSATATSSLNETSLRTLAGVASGAISISNFYGKSNGFTSVSILDLGSGYFTYTDNYLYAEIILAFGPDGFWDILDSYGPVAGSTWGTPTGGTKGSAYWIKFTRTGIAPSGSSGSSTPTTGWLNLGTTQQVVVGANPGLGSRQASYTIQISSDSAGSTILTSGTVTLHAVDGAMP